MKNKRKLIVEVITVTMIVTALVQSAFGFLFSRMWMYLWEKFVNKKKDE